MTTLDREEGRSRLRRLAKRVRAAVMVRPPVLTVSEWADAFRHLSRESSPEPGPWRTSMAPYLRDVMDACSDLTVERVVMMTSSQVGKTEVENNVLGYFMHQDPAPVLVVHPTVDMGKAWSQDRFAPMLRDTPVLKGLVSAAKSRDSGNTIMHKKYPGGHVTVSGANSAASLASRPIRVVLADEIDRYPASAGTEGDPLQLAIKRTAAFWNRRIIVVSTPTLKGHSRIEKEYEQSTQGRFHVPCPDCGEYQPLMWSNIKWENNDPTTAVYVCEHCGAVIEESDKPAMIRDGKWVHQFPERRRRGFHINALYPLWTRWSEVVQEFLDAKGNPELLKVWVNTALGESWEEAGERISADELRHRLEEYPAELPAGIGILTLAVDVQGDRLEYQIKGWGAAEESWLIEWGQIWGDPGSADVWRELDGLVGRTWELESEDDEPGATLTISAGMVDSGGHHTEQVYKWTKRHRSRRIFACKGMGQEGRPLLSRPSTANKGKVPLYSIGTITAKDTIFSRMKVTRPGPGYMHLPDDTDEEYLAQMTSEKVVTRMSHGRPVRRYEKTRPRNEALDLEVYSLAALYVLGPQTVNSLGVIAQRVAGNRDVVEEEPQPMGRGELRNIRKPKRRKGWVNNW